VLDSCFDPRLVPDEPCIPINVRSQALVCCDAALEPVVVFPPWDDYLSYENCRSPPTLDSECLLSRRSIRVLLVG
jgi:hypothetical protein